MTDQDDPRPYDPEELDDDADELDELDGEIDEANASSTKDPEEDLLDELPEGMPADNQIDIDDPPERRPPGEQP